MHVHPQASSRFLDSSTAKMAFRMPGIGVVDISNAWFHHFISRHIGLQYSTAVYIVCLIHQFVRSKVRCPVCRPGYCDGKMRCNSWRM